MDHQIVPIPSGATPAQDRTVWRRIVWHMGAEGCTARSTACVPAIRLRGPLMRFRGSTSTGGRFAEGVLWNEHAHKPRGADKGNALLSPRTVRIAMQSSPYLEPRECAFKGKTAERLGPIRGQAIEKSPAPGCEIFERPWLPDFGRKSCSNLGVACFGLIITNAPVTASPCRALHPSGTGRRAS
jgi:hypothetical protein